jgi:hypothetical protein
MAKLRLPKNPEHKSVLGLSGMQGGLINGLDFQGGQIEHGKHCQVVFVHNLFFVE